MTSLGFCTTTTITNSNTKVSDNNSTVSFKIALRKRHWKSKVHVTLLTTLDNIKLHINKLIVNIYIADKRSSTFKHKVVKVIQFQVMVNKEEDGTISQTLPRN